MTAEEKLRKNIISLRESRNWSQKELASRLGMDSSYISKIESGNRKVSTPELNELAGLFEVSADYLLGRSPTKNNETHPLTVKEALDSVMSSDGKGIREADKPILEAIISKYLAEAK